MIDVVHLCAAGWSQILMRARDPDPRMVCAKVVQSENTADDSDGAGDGDDHNHDENHNNN